MSLEGTEVALKITEAGAKNLAVLLYAVLKEEKKTRGKARLTSLLRSGRELKVFPVRNADLNRFTKEAKRYGILYCVLADKEKKDPNGVADVIARAEDAPKINRIVERFLLATVKETDGGANQGKKAKEGAASPFFSGRTPPSRSAPSSGPPARREGTSFTTEKENPSVKETLQTIREERGGADAAKEKRETPGRAGKTNPGPSKSGSSKAPPRPKKKKRKTKGAR